MVSWRCGWCRDRIRVWCIRRLRPRSLRWWRVCRRRSLRCRWVRRGARRCRRGSRRRCTAVFLGWVSAVLVFIGTGPVCSGGASSSGSLDVKYATESPRLPVAARFGPGRCSIAGRRDGPVVRHRGATGRSRFRRVKGVGLVDVMAERDPREQVDRLVHLVLPGRSASFTTPA